jgi:hypothetical protein
LRAAYAAAELAETYDISTDGCMLQGSSDFCNAGDDIELTFSGLTVGGRVVWVKHRNAGVQFAPEVSADTIAAILGGNALERVPPLARYWAERQTGCN